MGQARNRGTFEQRKAQSIKREQDKKAKQIAAYESKSDEEKIMLKEKEKKRAMAMAAILPWIAGGLSITQIRCKEKP